MINLPEKEELRLQGRNAIRARILGRRSCLDQIERAFHGWRSLVGYSPWGCKESDTTERLHLTLPYISAKLTLTMPLGSSH